MNTPFSAGTIGTTRIANDESRWEREVARGERGVGLAVEHRAEGGEGDFPAGLLDGGERRRDKRCELYVVKTGDAHFLGHAHAGFVQRAEQERGGVIVGAEEGVGERRGGEIAEETFVGHLADAHPVASGFGIAAREGFADAGDARVHSRRGARARDEMQAFAAEF